MYLFSFQFDSISVSQEENVSDNHDIELNGYNVGRYVTIIDSITPPSPVDDLHARDALVLAALGTTSFGGISYSTTAETLNGVMTAGSGGVNHGKLRS